MTVEDVHSDGLLVLGDVVAMRALVQDGRDRMDFSDVRLEVVLLFGVVCTLRTPEHDRLARVLAVEMPFDVAQLAPQVIAMLASVNLSAVGTSERRPIRAQNPCKNTK